MLEIKGPDTVFSTHVAVTYRAVGAATPNAIEWFLRYQDYRTVRLETMGDTAIVPIPQIGALSPPDPKSPKQKGGRKRSSVKGSYVEIVARIVGGDEARKIVVVIGTAVPPYSALTVPILDRDIIQGSKQFIPGGPRLAYYSTKVGKASFAIGREFRSGTRVGLFSTPAEGPWFSANAFAIRYGQWARLLDATTVVEGGQNFVACNTYDDAQFTFGLIQFTPHEPDINLVALLRTWLAREDAARYFPELELRAGRIARRNGPVLEDPNHNAGLRDFLNPGIGTHDLAEARNLARLIHLMRHDPVACEDQVRLAITYFAQHLLLFKKDGIDGRADYVCAVIGDILNQGRRDSNGDKPLVAIRKRLTATIGGRRPTDQELFERLLEIDGKGKYAGRIASLRKHIAAMKDKGELGLMKFKLDNITFVPIGQPNSSLPPQYSPDIP